jgi:Zn-dependent M28 family amino/carboxypeptidase
MKKLVFLCSLLLLVLGCQTSSVLVAQQTSSAIIPDDHDTHLYAIIDSVSAKRLEHDIRKLAGFGTRSTLSDTVSETRGIGAARRWIKKEFEEISTACNGCLDVTYQKYLVPAEGNRRFDSDTWVVNVVAVQKGYLYPNRYIIMSGDIDSRASNVMDGESDAPGANDNASGMAGTMEAARVLSKYRFPVSVVYAGLSGEEQGLFGGKKMAEVAKEEGWDVIGILNNDMIGNIKGVDGVIDNSTFRVFSEAVAMTEDDRAARMRRFYGGEVDGPSRQLARYIHKLTDQFMTNLRAIMIYRLDRFGRGGHHRPFNDAGFPGVRIMETHENYTMQHQDIRVENGIAYGDVLEGVDFDYCAKLTAVNAITLAALAKAPPAPKMVKIGGAVRSYTTLAWESTDDELTKGYKIYWRDTTSPQWQWSKYVGHVDRHTLEGIVIDNYLFGVAAVGKDGSESVVSYPTGILVKY